MLSCVIEVRSVSTILSKLYLQNYKYYTFKIIDVIILLLIIGNLFSFYYHKKLSDMHNCFIFLKVISNYCSICWNIINILINGYKYYTFLNYLFPNKVMSYTRQEENLKFKYVTKIVKKQINTLYNH